MEDQPNRRWAQYVAHVIRGLTNKAAAERAGVAPGTIGNWLDPTWVGQPSADAVNRFALAFGLDPTQTAARAGVLPSTIEGSVISAPPNLKDIPTEALIAELGERAARGFERDHPPVATMERRRRRPRLRFDPSAPPV
jgi:transcriptional regulator with XRE-family HTH domain